jgi:hypothetical protein
MYYFYLNLAIFDLQNADFSQGIEFKTYGKRKPNKNAFTLILIVGIDVKWTKLKVSYFANSRPDIFFGFYCYGNFFNYCRFCPS